jgi:hypothetical protein
MNRQAIFLSVLVAFVVAQSAQAGTFVIERVWYANGLQSADRMSKRVGAEAVYSGTLDLNDRNWALEANLVVGGTTYWASGVRGSAIHAQMRVTCSDIQCGGFHEFDRCPETTFSGYGVVAIYHQFHPEIDREDLPSGMSDCVTEESPDPSDGPILKSCAPECGSPIVVDLDRGGFRFTDLAGGVRFDLDGDGMPEALSWLEPGSGDGWLALDRDGDGAIGSGAELFGDATPQPQTAEPQGYSALAVFDTAEHGGNGDGEISAADAIFSSLRLWIDDDHDGVSQPSELLTLTDAGVRSIDLDFVETRARDRYGNELRYAGRVGLARGTTRSVDVFLLAAD